MINSAYTLFNLDPFQDIRRLQYDINRLFEGVRGEFPAVNVWTGEDGAIVTAELPGIRPDDIEISVVGESVVLRGNRPGEEIAGDWLRRERPLGQFVRTLELPFRVEAGKVEARFSRGLLEISLPRAESEKPRKISVQAR